MSHPNETMIRTAYDAVSTGDLQPMLGMLSDKIRWNVSGDSPLAGDYEGKDGVVQFFGAMAHQYDNTLNVQLREVLANDHRAVVLTAESGTVDGHQLKWTSAHVFSITDGSSLPSPAIRTTPTTPSGPRSASPDSRSPGWVATRTDLPRFGGHPPFPPRHRPRAWLGRAARQVASETA
jgi:uncharacterized protein